MSSDDHISESTPASDASSATSSKERAQSQSSLRSQDLTVDEKISLLSGASFWKTEAIEHAKISAAILTDGPHGVRYQSTGDGDHLGLNSSDQATAFPTASATGSSWDPSLLYRIGEALAVEARAVGIDVLLGPGVNIKRSPLCGRNFEYFSEDPLLSGWLGAAWVEGLQSLGVGASVKHFAVNNQETERFRVSAEVDERTLREIYLPAFERIVTHANPATVMSSYNRINGTYASENFWLLTELLRGEWGFKGYVVSDWGGVRDAVASLQAGLDLSMPALFGHDEQVREGLRDQRLLIPMLEQATERITTTHSRLRDIRTETTPGELDVAAHHRLARQAATESAVLLQNDGGLLPLSPDATTQVAVIGEFAQSPRYQGSGSSQINPYHTDNAYDEFSKVAAAQLRFAPGFRLDGEADEELLREAVEAAEQAEVAVVFLGLPHAEESEGFDREHMDLPAVQLHTLEAVAAVQSDVVVVLSNGSVVDLSAVVQHSRAVVEMWLAGQASGSAIAELIFGIAEPGGRLAETIPVRLSDTPAYLNWPGTTEEVHYGERIYVGYRYYDTVGTDVQFPFGFGLSYTNWELGEVTVTVPDLDPIDSPNQAQNPAQAQANVSLEVTNTGSRSGSEVVQVYVSADNSDVDRPLRELRGFQKVHAAPGETTTVSIDLDSRAFAHWGTNGWVVEPGPFQIQVGTSSRNIVFSTSVEFDLPPVLPALHTESTYADWVKRPDGAAVLERITEFTGEQGPEMLKEPGAAELIGSMPVVRLLRMSGYDGDTIVSQMLATLDDHR